MRMFALLCLCMASLAAQETPVPKPQTSAQTNQQKARAVVDQMIAALGGQAYLNVQDYYAEGRSGSFHNESLVSWSLFYRYWKSPDKDRYEITKERDIVELYVGYLRRKVDAVEPHLIHTVRGVGYVIRAPR